MLKPRKFDIADSNIANFGTAMEHKLKQAAADKETAWASAGLEVGLQIWRVEKFHVVEWPKKNYGWFFDGDSYILLNTYKKPETPDKLFHEIHFWIGLNSTQDEYGTAAYKTVELDDHLRGDAPQHREVQGEESKLFLSYFKVFNVRSGGVESGFHHVGPAEYKTRLLRLKQLPGTKNVVVREVPIDIKSLNSSDVFLLDGGIKLFHFNGKLATPQEKFKCNEVTREIENQRADHMPKLFFIEEDDNDVASRDFWEYFGGKQPIAEKSPEIVLPEKKLFRMSDEKGKLELIEVKPFARASLESRDAWVIDAGYQVYVWISKNADDNEKKKGLAYATDYLFKNGRPKTLPVSRIVEGNETQEFWDIFK